MIECLKVHEYICKKSSKLNHKWHILSYYIEKERKILIPTYVKHMTQLNGCMPRDSWF